MKTFLKSKLIVFTSIVVFASIPLAQSAAMNNADKNTLEWKYEIEGAGVGNQGTYLVKVWSYCKFKKIAITQSKKNAVHGIIFKGFSASNLVKSGQKPLIREPGMEAKHEIFFRDFFADGGRYMKFVSSSSDEVTELVKVGKEYKAGVVVTVNVSELRKDLEDAGIIKGLSNGF
jgi:hypothetical protein